MVYRVFAYLFFVSITLLGYIIISPSENPPALSVFLIGFVIYLSFIIFEIVRHFSILNKARVDCLITLCAKVKTSYKKRAWLITSFIFFGGLTALAFTIGKNYSPGVIPETLNSTEGKTDLHHELDDIKETLRQIRKNQFLSHNEKVYTDDVDKIHFFQASFLENREASITGYQYLISLYDQVQNTNSYGPWYNFLRGEKRSFFKIGFNSSEKINKINGRVFFFKEFPEDPIVVVKSETNENIRSYVYIPVVATGQKNGMYEECYFSDGSPSAIEIYRDGEEIKMTVSFNSEQDYLGYIIHPTETGYFVTLDNPDIQNPKKVYKVCGS